MLISLVYLKLFLIVGVVCKTDYLYDHEANGWLKLHRVPATWQDAFQTCYYEGAILASPLTAPLATALNNLVLGAKLQNIYLGANALLSKRDYISLEGIPFDDMTAHWAFNYKTEVEDCLALSVDTTVHALSCTSWLPFVCYRRNDGTAFNVMCGTFDDKYIYNEVTGSCYKWHEEKRTWTEAHKVCLAEGGHLVVVNNKDEADIITAMYPPKDTNSTAWTWEPVHIGLRDWNKDGLTWVTVTGEKLENVYNTWAATQPDNIGVNICGNLLRDGTLDESWCSGKFKFVCEKNPNASRFESIPDEEVDLDAIRRKRCSRI